MNDKPVKCPLCNNQGNQLYRSCRLHRFFRCPRCDLSFSWPLRNRDEILELFDDYEWTSSYSKLTSTTLSIAVKALGKKIETAEVLGGNNKILSMLDVGCGNGMYVEAAGALGIRAVGTEVDATNAKRGLERGLDIRHGFLEELDLGESAFNFVHIKGVLHFSHDPKNMLNKICRCLAPDGIIYFDVNNQDGLASIIRKRMRPSKVRYGQLEPPSHCIGYSRQSLDYLLGAVNLKSLKKFSFSYGDSVYYPKLGTAPLRGIRFPAITERALRIVDFVGMGGFQGIYCRK